MAEHESGTTRPPSLSLGSRACWIGPTVYALAALAFTLLTFVELVATRSHPSLTVAAKAALGFVACTLEESLAFVQWRASVLLLSVAGLVALAAGVHALVQATRQRVVAVLAMVLIAGLTVGGHYVLTFETSTSLMSQVVDLLRIRSSNNEFGDLWGLVLVPKRGAESIALVLGLAMASVLILPTLLTTEALAKRVRLLRRLLYTTSVLLVAGIFMTESTYAWLVSVAEPASALRSELAGLVSAGTLLAGAFYTLTLLIGYLPAAIVLGEYGRRLSTVATEETPEEEPTDWLARNGLTISWRGQLVRTATVLAPLLSSAVVNAITSLA